MRIVATGLILFTMAGCTTTSKLSNQNLSYLYYKGSSIMHPEYRVYHVSDSVSRLYCSINTDEFLYSKDGDNQKFTAAYMISYKLFSSFESKEVIDSTSATFVYDKSDGRKQIINSIDFKAQSPNSYLLEVSAFDIKRKQSAKMFVNIDKGSKYTKQFFKVDSKIKKQTNFNPVVHGRDVLAIKPAMKDISKMYVKYYDINFPVSLPPFSVQEPKKVKYWPDTLYQVILNEEGIVESTMDKKGIYHFQIDTITREGLTFFHYYNDFPKLTSADQMIGPLRYITTKQEFTEMMTTNDKKTAVDNFWLNITGNPDRGKKVIKKFYARVQDANQYFTSYLEGWKSDRGMIYIVYGAPDVVYKNSFSENWIYGEEGNLVSLNFAFVNVLNPLTDKDFKLDRSPIYKNSWYLAVDAWRQGIVY
ncbi:MAG TPA: GWxTD domain-containing protein [Flavobacteriales bacterium]|nr:GWxTD domain-containing protein [Flavobacteriales bacterium]HIA11241.1 GWxTD domain-containing protein [Flavobacteriales bacterium]HIO71963.1 GWxTD domain-containing protein [Flavobacteriales bacterium]